MDGNGETFEIAVYCGAYWTTILTSASVNGLTLFIVLLNAWTLALVDLERTLGL
jgi:hypothetical protein